jgi:predicted outer membrane repeat protein
VEEANAFAGTDTITFSVSGMITLGSTLPAISDDLTIDASGYSVTISGDNLYRVMHINTGISVTLIYLSIYGGLASGSTGGGVENNGGTLTVTNCSFTGNNARWGGAISTQSGTLTVTGSGIAFNNATASGGGIYVATSTATVSGSTIDSNTSLDGGGIMSFYATVTVSGSGFSSNSVTGSGAGILNLNDLLTVTNSTFSGNNADYGGAISNVNSTSTAIVADSTFSGNTAATRGGGIYAELGTVTATRPSPASRRSSFTTWTSFTSTIVSFILFDSGSKKKM